MAPAIVSDSNISLSPTQIRDLPLALAPLEVRIKDRVYADGVDLTSKEFYRMLRSERVQPSTSAPSPGSFLKAFEQAAAYSNEIICITLSAELSATYNSAREAMSLAESELPQLTIKLIDSRSAAAAQALIVLDAARAAAAGNQLTDIAIRVEQRMRDTTLIGYLDSLDYISRSGRLPRVVSWMSQLLNVKPLLQLSDGRIGLLERPRTESKAMQRLVALAEEKLSGRPGSIAVVHADEPQKAEHLATRLRSRVAIEQLFITELPPVIGAHTGPGLVGCAFHPVHP